MEGSSQSGGGLRKENLQKSPYTFAERTAHSCDINGQTMMLNRRFFIIYIDHIYANVGKIRFFSSS